MSSDSFALGRRRWGLTGENLDHLLADPRQVSAQADEDLGRHALTFAYETQEDVLGTDAVVPRLERLTQGQLEDLLGPGCKGWRADGRRARRPDGLFYPLPDVIKAHAQLAERFGGHSVALA